jgi:hypothetical protein
MRASPVTGASTVVNHNTSVGPSVPSAAVQARIDRGEIRLICMHCSHAPLPGGALRGIPEVGPYKGTTRTTGQFCSFECMLGHTLEHRTYRSPMQRAAIIEMAHLEMGVDHVTPAGPRTELAVFGGPYTIEEFRGFSASGRLLRHLATPFVSPMAISEVYQREGAPAEEAAAPTAPAAPAGWPEREAAPIPQAAPEHAGDDGSMSQLNEWGLRGLRRPPTQPEGIVEPPSPPPASFYQQYVDTIEQEGSEGAAPAAEQPPPRRAEPRRRASRSSAPGGAAGGLSRFLKPA